MARSAGTRPSPSDLHRNLLAVARVAGRLVSDVHDTCQGDPRFLDAFRRWQETLCHLRLCLLRAENGLLHYLMVPEEFRPWRDLPGPARPHQPIYATWQNRLRPWFRQLHIDTLYRRLPDLLDLTAEASSADIVTDLVAVCALAEISQTTIDRFTTLEDPAVLEDLAFYHLISPWKQHGLQALADLTRWLDATLAEHESL